MIPGGVTRTHAANSSAPIHDLSAKPTDDPHRTPKKCVDTLKNCASYPAEICTSADYRFWMEDHCCAFCSGDRPTGTVPYVPPTHSGICDNQIDCDVYEDSACVGVFTPWAFDKCPLRCGYCSHPEPCFDKIDYCDQYTKDVCIVDTYRIWARRNCRKYCGICYSTGTYVEPTVNPHHVHTEAPYTGSTIAPIEGPGKIIASQQTFLVEGPPSALPDRCMYKGNNYMPNQKWNDGCSYVCSCFDTKTNRMICTDRCSNWDIQLPIKNCSLVQEPGECCKRLECEPE
ncbi:hypothetical protein LOTGIDRAFT_159081 [Lottia gigantea]|uniref:VWFC domain-containing protein n=1 Tax=Lottia gigantea TaxID=225164 RepID=V4ATP3_LOTGI|nr:hypothetical protein LOTGIDRAFT_159081 [Lottia gigantea]ESO98285.1 hypothetical protein LOTGIDRAFT_159081 [Lottia gigantea]